MKNGVAGYCRSNKNASLRLAHLKVKSFVGKVGPVVGTMMKGFLGRGLSNIYYIMSLFFIFIKILKRLRQQLLQIQRQQLQRQRRQ